MESAWEWDIQKLWMTKENRNNKTQRKEEVLLSSCNLWLMAGDEVAVQENAHGKRNLVSEH